MQKENIFAYLKEKISSSVWIRTQESLLDYNKSIITLSSSALVLSFSLIKITNVSINKYLIGLSWTFFLLTIFSGILTLFIKFLYDLVDGVIKREAKAGKYKKDKNILRFKEIIIYFKTREFIFWLAIFQLILFCLAFLLFIIAAFLSI